MKKVIDINLNLMYIYVLLIFFIVHPNFHWVVKLGFISAFLLINLMYYCKYKITVKTTNFILFNIVLFIYIVYILFSTYDKVFSILSILFLLIVYLAINKNEKIEIKTSTKVSYREKLIYLVFFISIIVQITLGKSEHHKGYMVLLFQGDKNYSGVVMFLFFLYCYKNNFFLGKVFTLMVSIFIGSRALFMMIILFYIIRMNREFYFKLLRKVGLMKIENLLISVFVFSILFSYFWVYVVSVDNLKEYQSGLNDESNRMRFVANIYAVDLIIENKELLLYGYGDSFKEVFNIDNDIYSTHPTYLGTRIVQPHNSILNIIIKIGVLPSLVYFFILSKILKKLYNKDNIEYIIPYMINTMFLHQMLDTNFMIFWILVLYIPQKNIKRKILLP